MIKKNKLTIFDNFFIDKKLTKSFTEKSASTNDDPSDNAYMEMSGDGSIPFSGVLREPSEAVALRDYADYVYYNNRTIFNWLNKKLVHFYTRNTPDKIKKGVIKYQTIESFFKKIHDAVSKLYIDKNSIIFYTDKITEAVSNGQQAYAETLASKKHIIVRELNMLENGFTSFVLEDDIIRFHKLFDMKDSFLKLTYIKNFAREIPTDVIAKKQKCDQHYMFDNYVILHFDPNDDSDKMTKKEIEKAKDPILFGLIKGSRKLYYVGDWVDEYCNLTLDVLLDTLDKEHADTITKKNMIKNIIK